uniref:Uncharacterized protein n=1 Tax=viral metagenome TaxID=1070528 RepID=A0A6M3LNG1_9ZZZZ
MQNEYSVPQPTLDEAIDYFEQFIPSIEKFKDVGEVNCSVKADLRIFLAYQALESLREICRAFANVN